ncbi:MAG TPA: acetate--CoA ligase family protein [Pseudonocardiaceae bacterium]|nr:acetate--CoA ligase family protein [Pseudonocardiaceae bacterium]
MATTALGRLLDPASVAVIGARDAPGNRGATAVRMLRKFGYAGDVYPVHPGGAPVAGHRTYASVAELPAVPDVAIVGVGAARVAGVVPSLADAGVGSVVVWAGGFAETGAAGAALQRELAARVREHGMRMLGPNCLGVVNTASAFTGTFAYWLGRTDTLLPGVISMVSQSGGLAASAHAWSQAGGVGFRHMVSTGNEVDVTAVEVLDHFVDDPGSRVLCCYLEGVDDGEALVRVLRRARAAGKPVVVLKGGRSDASAAAVAAHTGALAGQARVWEAVLDAEGAVRVFSVEELVEVVAYLAGTVDHAPLHGNRVAVLSYGGGQGVLAADQCVEAGLSVPVISEKTQALLRPLAPRIASLRNPLDLTPEAFNSDRWRAAFPELLRTLVTSGEVDAVLCQLGGMAQGAAETATAVAELHAADDVPVAVQSRAYPAEAAAVFANAGIHVFTEQPRAITTLGRLAAAVRPTGGAVDVPDIRMPDLPDVTDGAVLPEHAVHALLTGAGLRTLRGGLARSPGEATEIAYSISGPVAMKVVSRTVTHRAKAGLLALDVLDPVAVFERLAARSAEIGADMLGVFVEEMAPRGTELLVSAFRDATFGPVVSVGAGGNAAELIDDVTFAPAPLDGPAATAMLSRLRTVDGLPGDPVPFLVRFSRLAARLPWQRYVLELNPLSVTADDVVPLDGLLIVERV